MTNVTDLSDKWIAYRAPNWVEGWISPSSKDTFDGPEVTAWLLQQIVDSGEIPVEETVQLQCLGTYLGQAIAEKTGWEWKVVEDEYGTDLAIEVPGKQAWIFPVTIVFKRIEDGEEVDVLELFNGVVPLAQQTNADSSEPKLHWICMSAQAASKRLLGGVIYKVLFRSEKSMRSLLLQRLRMFHFLPATD